MQLTALLKQLTYQGPIDPNTVIESLVYDSRKVQPGALYACMKGTQTDGHLYISQALEAGATAVLVEENWLAKQAHLDPAISWIAVADTAAALAQISAAFYGHPSQEMTLIGVTGTNGKTTTTALIQQLLTALNQPCGQIGTLGATFGDYTLPAQYTTPFAPELQQMLREMRDRGAQAVVMEASSHALVQRRLDAVAFDRGVFTNLTQDHLDYHGSMAAYCEAKELLFSRLLMAEGQGIINRDDPASSAFVAHCGEQMLSYAIEQPADLRAEAIDYGLAGVRFQLAYQNQAYPVTLRLPGRFNVYNALAALGVVLSLGYSLDSALVALEALPGVPGRLEVVSDPQHPFTVVVDYAHTPDSLANVLQAARQFTQRQVLAVFGCGGDRDTGKRPQMGRIGAEMADCIVITSDNPRSEEPDAIIADIVAGLPPTAKPVVEPDRRQAIGTAIGLAQPGDVVVIAGKGHENYQIFKDRTIHFDDREEARQALERL